MSNIKQDIKSFYCKLRRDVFSREKNYNNKSEAWQNSLNGIYYDVTTTELNDLLNSVEAHCNKLGINLPYLK